MELRHCKYFIAVAEELNFRRAAERLHMEQPSLSRQIRQLEDEMGVELFLRNKQGTQLTEAGQIFLEEARALLAQAEKTIESVQKSLKPQRITIGFSMCAFGGLLPDVVQKFRYAFPEVEISLKEMTTSVQIQALLDGEIAVGFLHAPIKQPKIVAKIAASDFLVVALPDSHPLAQETSISLKALDNEGFVIFPRVVQPEFYDRVLEVCRSAGFEPKIQQEVTPPEVAIAFVGAGAGVALVASHYQEKSIPGVVYRPLIESTPPLEMAIAWHQDNSSKVLQQFLSVVEGCGK